MKKVLIIIFLLIIIPIILSKSFDFYKEEMLANHPPPEYLGMDPVEGEEAQLSLEEKEKILEKNGWFFGPYKEVQDNFYFYMEFNQENVDVFWGSHAVSRYDYGPPSLLSYRWTTYWEETWTYELTESGLYLWDQDGDFLGLIDLKFTKDQILSASIPSWKDMPEGRDLYAYEDKGE
ncbi:MAG: hypothetical protein Q4E36_06635 [Bacillota bacterium]|nr:hypothetical protein [Bacillota bacterium]